MVLLTLLMRSHSLVKRVNTATQVPVVFVRVYICVIAVKLVRTHALEKHDVQITKRQAILKVLDINRHWGGKYSKAALVSLLRFSSRDVQACPCPCVCVNRRAPQCSLRNKPAPLWGHWTPSIKVHRITEILDSSKAESLPCPNPRLAHVKAAHVWMRPVLACAPCRCRSEPWRVFTHGVVGGLTVPSQYSCQEPVA